MILRTNQSKHHKTVKNIQKKFINQKKKMYESIEEFDRIEQVKEYE